MEHWGKHLIVDVKSGNENVRDGDYLANFVEKLVELIDMKAYGKPWVEHFGTGAPAGYTVVQLIETSNICGHFCDETGDFYLDVFSCKDFNENIVTDYIQQCFFPESIKSEVILRDARK
jgi:S-adenosylmethionine/arginine decarboxylase-like enzyme